MAVYKFKWEVMNPILKQKDAQIESLKSNINLRDHRIKNLETEVSNYSRVLSDLEQYGRWQSIRLYNISFPHESEKVILDVINRTLTDDKRYPPLSPIGKTQHL